VVSFVWDHPEISAFEEDPMWYIGESTNVDLGSTGCRHINACHPKEPPAPDPVKLDPNHSLLGGERGDNIHSCFKIFF
jgi:hypothetical protein